MPIKRELGLQPLSRDHHHGLLFCWKLREGGKRNVQYQRIKEYAIWFWENHLKKHFELEEQYLFPILDSNHPMIKKAITEHRRLKRLFEEKNEIVKSLSQIEEELESHIRFEERTLFNEIQLNATPEQLIQLEVTHAHSTFNDDWSDEFWK